MKAEIIASVSATTAKKININCKVRAKKVYAKAHMSHICERIEAQCVYVCAILSNKRDLLQLYAISSKWAWK